MIIKVEGNYVIHNCISVREHLYIGRTILHDFHHIDWCDYCKPYCQSIVSFISCVRYRCRQPKYSDIKITTTYHKLTLKRNAITSLAYRFLEILTINTKSFDTFISSLGSYHIDSALVYGMLLRYRSSLHLFMEVNEKVLFVGKIKLVLS